MLNNEAAKGYVYIIQVEGTNRVKVGFSINPTTRLKELQTGSPNRLILLSTSPGTMALEKRIHRRLASYSCGGEWFELPPLYLLEIGRLFTGEQMPELVIPPSPAGVQASMEWRMKKKRGRWEYHLLYRPYRVESRRKKWLASRTLFYLGLDQVRRLTMFDENQQRNALRAEIDLCLSMNSTRG